MMPLHKVCLLLFSQAWGFLCTSHVVRSECRKHRLCGQKTVHTVARVTVTEDQKDSDRPSCITRSQICSIVLVVT